MSESVRGLEGISHHDVYAKYPDFYIDVADEQALCQEHDVIVFQHPIQWYSCPALMKEWIDRVLTYGWAHGPGGTKLQSKAWLSATSAGWNEPDYRPDGLNRTSLHEFLFAQACSKTVLVYHLVSILSLLSDTQYPDQSSEKLSQILPNRSYLLQVGILRIYQQILAPLGSRSIFV